LGQLPQSAASAASAASASAAEPQHPPAGATRTLLSLQIHSPRPAATCSLIPLIGPAHLAAGGRRIKLAVLDHVASFPPVLLPVAKLAAMCRTAGARVLVDGAHALGCVSHLDVPSLGGRGWGLGSLPADLQGSLLPGRAAKQLGVQPGAGVKHNCGPPHVLPRRRALLHHQPAQVAVRAQGLRAAVGGARGAGWAAARRHLPRPRAGLQGRLHLQRHPGQRAVAGGPRLRGGVQGAGWVDWRGLLAGGACWGQPRAQRAVCCARWPHRARSTGVAAGAQVQLLC
jgi:hypothetical protein